jgi:hypothetical protein
MSSWFIILNIILLLSTSFIQAHNRVNSKRRFPGSTGSIVPKPPPSKYSFDKNFVYALHDDSLIESTTAKPKNHANEEQIKQFTRLLYDRLNLKEQPNVTIDPNDGTGIPSIVKQLEKEHIQHNEEIHSYQRQKNREESQATTERAILPGDSIPHHTCQRQLAAKFNFNKDNLHNIDCFRFTKSHAESKSLPTNQIIKELRIYVKKNYFNFNNEQDHTLTPDMFQIYQVFRPTANDASYNPFHNFTDTIRLSISKIKQLNRNWFELTIDPNSGPINIQQIYKQFITPWYGLAINHVVQSSRPSFYRRYYSKKHYENVLRTDDQENENKDLQHQLPYMVVEYGPKISPSSGLRSVRSAKGYPARACDPKSPCCRRSLTIDLDHIGALDFVIYPRQIDIGECTGLCGTSGSSLKYPEVKNAQHKNEANSAHNLLLLHQNHMLSNRNTTTTHVNKPDQQTVHCCSYSRTGGLELMYTTTNGGPIIRKFIPNMVVEECRCGLPATIQQI